MPNNILFLDDTLVIDLREVILALADGFHIDIFLRGIQKPVRMKYGNAADAKTAVADIYGLMCKANLQVPQT